MQFLYEYFLDGVSNKPLQSVPEVIFVEMGWEDVTTNISDTPFCFQNSEILKVGFELCSYV